ncbi:MAG: hypothetical protein JXR37_31355 [Kiritimatiellae bacterium]|nr:hypothetical protein [Kiritimatiellia bacterium]
MRSATLWVLLAATVLPGTARAESPLVLRTRGDTEWLAGYPNRVVGTAEHDKALGELLAKVKAVPGVRVWTQPFTTVAPVFEEAHLTISAGLLAGRHRVYPIWPGMVRLNTTPTNGIAGRLVYVGKATHAEVPPRSLRGQIAVVEMSGGDKWMNAWNAGAEALILLGSDDVSIVEAHAHLMRLPVYCPRFYLPPGTLADALRRGDIPRGRLFAAAAWKEVEATNIYALVKPRDRAAPQQAFAIGAAFDSAGVVPELAAGADTAVDTAFLLNVLRKLADSPPARPVLFTFADAYAVNQLGAREMLASFGITREERDLYLAEDVKVVEEYETHEALARQIDAADDPFSLLHLSQKTTPKWVPWLAIGLLAAGSIGVGFLWGWKKSIAAAAVSLVATVLIVVLWVPAVKAQKGMDYTSLHRYAKDEVAREVVALENELMPLRLEAHRETDPEKKAALDKQVKELEDARMRYLAAQVQMLTPSKLDEKIQPIAEQLWLRARKRISGQLKEAKRLFEEHERQDKMRLALLAELGFPAQPGAPGSTREEKIERPVEFLLGIDLSDAGVAAGPSLWCRYLRQDEKANSKDFRTWLNLIRKKPEELEKVWNADVPKAVNLEPLLGMDAVDSHVVGGVANFTSPAQSFGIQAMSWSTLDGFRTKADTPNDHPARLDWKRLGPQIDATWALIRRAVCETDFKATSKIVSRWRGVRGTIVDQSPGEAIPRLPMNDYLTTLVSGNSSGGRGGHAWREKCAGVRLYEFCFTGVDGRFQVGVLPGHCTRGAQRFFVQSFKLAKDGRPVRAIDMNRAGKGVRLNIDILSADASPLRAVAFDCQELTGVDYLDPRFLRNLYASSILDAVRAGKPQRGNFSISGPEMAAMLEPGTRWQLILRLGTTQNRMALINMAVPDESAHMTPREAMRGFEIGRPLPQSPTYVALHDFWNLDERRLRDYSKAGITSKAIQQIRARTRMLMTEADTALAQDDGAGFFRATIGAMANEVRAYQAIRYTANDVVRAAVFLLLAIVPFSFALERLVLATPHIYKQIIGTITVFVVMVAILWSFHPAFRISNQPLMIIMAFGVIALSLLVISVVFGRFETSLEEMRSGRAESSGARTSRGGVVSSAVRLGIANMRKRKLRTALTGTTIILITFALLCFTSVSNYVGQKQFRLDVAAPYTGLLIRQASTRPMPEQALEYMQTYFGAKEKTVPRYWWCNSWSPEWKLHVRNPATGKQLSLQAGLGLAPGEAALTGVDKTLPDWDAFVAEGGCYLAEKTAAELAVRPGDRLIVGGRSLKLVGVFDGARFASEVRSLDGQSLLPYDYSALGYEQRRDASSTWVELLNQKMESGEGLEPEEELPHISPTAVVIVPAAMCSGMPDCSLRSLSISAESPAMATANALEMARRLAFPVYFGSPQGVNVVAATGLKPRAPKSLILPLLIAGLIIFNTMLSSIAERKREIHVYTSLGLAPLHVGVLFLAEAITYGLMGAIFGYVVGQGAATGLSELGWLGSITLNYSGTQALATMVMVLVVVILSSLVPAFMAGKIASPSHEMSWKVPLPENDVIRDVLPFTVTTRAANGVVNFLHEYLEAHREGSIGNFSTDRLRVFKTRVQHHDVLGIEGTVWLAPYDLGVRQDIRILIRQTDEEDVCEIAIELFRGAGQVRSWWKLNRVFLGDLRKQLLGWRKVKTQRVLQYIADAAHMLAEAEA